MTAPPSDVMERCFAAHYPAIRAYFLRRCPTRADADEATADVFAIAWRRIDDLPPEPQARLWLFGVARNVLATQQRSGRRRDRLTVRLGAVAAREGADIAGDAVDALAVREALAQLPDADRELLALSAWEGLSPAEIAQVMGLSAPVVSARLYRARRRLARRLSAADPNTTHRSPAHA